MRDVTTRAGARDRVERALNDAYAAGVVNGDDGSSFSIYPTGTDQRQGDSIRQLVAAEGARRTFEVGFALGLSTLHIAAGLLDAGHQDAHHTAIDPTETWHWHSAGRRLVERAGLDGLVEIVEEKSQAILPRWSGDDERLLSFDVAFIDGDHRFDPCFVDIFYALPLVKPGGLLVVDDMWMPSVRTAVAFFESNVGLELLTDALPDAFHWHRAVPAPTIPSASGNTAVPRKPLEHIERPDEHFVPFW